MEFRILGSFEIWDGASQIEIRGAKRRALLALLLFHANEIVGKDRLIDELWGERAPRTAAASLHNHISGLRKGLGSDRLITRAWGYVLRVDPEQVDLHQFEGLIRDAEPLPAKERSAKLAEALALWRGPALADLVFEPSLANDIARLEELRLAVLEARIDADLELGRNAEIVGELEALIAEHPLRERLRGQLILALYRDGRQADALEVYRETRRLLADELGLEPSPALRELERAILRQDASLAPAASRPLVEDSQAMRRRWLVYAALAGTALLAAGGIEAVAAIRDSASPPRASSTARTNQVRAATLAPPIRPHQRTNHSATLVVHTAPSYPDEQITAKPTTTGTHRSRPARETAFTSLSEARSTSRPVSHLRSRQRSHKPPRAKNKRRTPPKMVRIDDTFDGSTINPQIWTYATWGTGADVAQQSGRLELTMHADATPDPRWNAMAGGYETACSFTGDFDARIDYTLIDWPAANGTVVALNVAFADNVVNIVRASRASGQEDYTFAAPSGESRVLLTTDMSGGFRMTRVGSLITSYIRNDRQWVKLDSAHRSGAIRMEPILWASGSDFAHKDVTVAFDNFVILAPRSGCA